MKLKHHQRVEGSLAGLPEPIAPCRHAPGTELGPDVRSPQFATQAHVQSLAVAESASAADDQAFVDAISEFPG